MLLQFVLYRTLIIRSQVNFRQVVEVIDVVLDENARLTPSKNCLAVETVCLDDSKETFGYRIVPIVSLSAHVCQASEPLEFSAMLIARVSRVRSERCSHPGAGRRVSMALRSASIARVVSILTQSAMPTTRRELRSMIVARYSQPSCAQMRVTSCKALWLSRAIWEGFDEWARIDCLTADGRSQRKLSDQIRFGLV